MISGVCYKLALHLLTRLKKGIERKKERKKCMCWNSGCLLGTKSFFASSFERRSISTSRLRVLCMPTRSPFQKNLSIRDNLRLYVVLNEDLLANISKYLGDDAFMRFIPSE